MRKNKAKATAMVDAFLAEPFTNDEERMQQIVEKAKAESLRRAAEQPERPKKKGLWRGAPAVCALVIILMVVPIVAVILNPVATSKANQLVRKATVWVNDTFKLGIELPVEGGKNTAYSITDSVFETVQNAADYIGKDILALDEKQECLIKSIELNVITDDYYILKMHYFYNEKELLLTLESAAMESIITPEDDVEEIETVAGRLWLWSAGDTQRAAGYLGDWEVQIYAPVERDEAVRIFKSLKWLN